MVLASRQNLRSLILVALLAATLSVVSMRPAAADPNDGIALNGVFDVVSDGQWAKTNERLDPRPTIASRWTFASMCPDYQGCTGTVVSEQGWTAETKYLSNVWYVRRTLPGWQQCPDGSSYDGHQTYTFWRDPTNVATLIGWDKTIGVSGACGINRWLAIKLPFRVTPV